MQCLHRSKFTQDMLHGTVRVTNSYLSSAFVQTNHQQDPNQGIFRRPFLDAKRRSRRSVLSKWQKECLGILTCIILWKPF